MNSRPPLMVVAGQPLLTTVMFQVENEFVVPDEGSVKITLNDTRDELQINVPAGAFQTTFEIPADFHVLADGLAFEARYFWVSYTVNGQLGLVGPKLRFWPTQRTLWEHGLRD